MGLIKQAGAEAAGVVVALDREERGQGELSAIGEIRQQYGIPVTSISESLDYFQRHPELSAGVASDMSDYFVRHPELLVPQTDLSDYFLRIHLR